MIEEQMTIFDVFDDMNKVEQDSLYDKCLVPGIKLVEVKGKMTVVDAETKAELFVINIKSERDGWFTFSYEAMDGYWSGDYRTNNFEEIRKSITNLSEDIRREW